MAIYLRGVFEAIGDAISLEWARIFTGDIHFHCISCTKYACCRKHDIGSRPFILGRVEALLRLLRKHDIGSRPRDLVAIRSVGQSLSDVCSCGGSSPRSPIDGKQSPLLSVGKGFHFISNAELRLLCRFSI